jgi:hypothetical protein
VDAVGRAAEIDVFLGRARDLQAGRGAAHGGDDRVVRGSGERLAPVGRAPRVQVHRRGAGCLAGDRIGDDLLEGHGDERVIPRAVAAVHRALDHRGRA